MHPLSQHSYSYMILHAHGRSSSGMRGQQPAGCVIHDMLESKFDLHANCRWAEKSGDDLAEFLVEDEENEGDIMWAMSALHHQGEADYHCLLRCQSCKNHCASLMIWLHIHYKLLAPSAQMSPASGLLQPKSGLHQGFYACHCYASGISV